MSKTQGPQATGVTGVSTTTRGLGKADPDANPQALSKAAAKWSSLVDLAEGLPWSAVPSGVLEDFVRAAANDMDAMYGQGAIARGLSVLAGALVRPDNQPVAPHPLSLAWSSSPARLDLAVSLEPRADGADPEVEFELCVPEGASDQDVRQALEDWAKDKGEPDQRLTFDPLDRVTGADLKPLCAGLEALFAQAGRAGEDSEADVLLAAAAIVLWWRHMEQANAEQGSVRLAGVTARGRPVCPGLDLVVQATRVGLEVGPSTPPASGTARARVSLRKH